MKIFDAAEMKEKLIWRVGNIIYVRLIDLCLNELRKEEDMIIDEICYRSPVNQLRIALYGVLDIYIVFFMQYNIFFNI